MPGCRSSDPRLCREWWSWARPRNRLRRLPIERRLRQVGSHSCEHHRPAFFEQRASPTPQRICGLGGACPSSRIRMSRTDTHAPFHVRLLRGEVAHRALHDCGGDPALCSLPDFKAGWTTGPGRCRWEWIFTGQNWCSCWMCHWPRHRQPRRSGRGAHGARLRGVARSWNGGDTEAGWAV